MLIMSYVKTIVCAFGALNDRAIAFFNKRWTPQIVVRFHIHIPFRDQLAIFTPTTSSGLRIQTQAVSVNHIFRFVIIVPYRDETGTSITNSGHPKKSKNAKDFHQIGFCKGTLAHIQCAPIALLE